jgi:uncharacterized protein
VNPASQDSDGGLSVRYCDTFLSRLKGFQGRREIAMDEVLWLKPCSAVHTIRMRVPLSLLFLDSQRQLVHVVPTARPCRVFVCWQARSVIEMRARHEQDIIEAWHHISISHLNT